MKDKKKKKRYLRRMAVAFQNPEIFLKASSEAGGYGQTVLFGLLPSALAVTSQHKDDPLNALAVTKRGGPGLGFLLIVGSTFVILSEAAQDLGLF